MKIIRTIVKKRKKADIVYFRRVELLDILNADGGKRWVQENKFDYEYAYETVCKCRDFLTHNSPHGSSGKGACVGCGTPGNLSPHQINLTKIIVSYLTDGKFSNAYHELYDVIDNLGAKAENMYQPEVAIVYVLTNMYISFYQRKQETGTGSGFDEELGDGVGKDSDLFQFLNDVSTAVNEDLEYISWKINYLSESFNVLISLTKALERGKFFADEIIHKQKQLLDLLGGSEQQNEIDNTKTM